MILKEFSKYGLPLTATFTLSYLIYSTSRFSLKYLGEYSDIGVFSVTYDFAQQSLLLLMMIINLASYPIIIKLLEDKKDKLVYQKLEENATLLFVVSIPATIGLIILTPNITYVVFGENYRYLAQKILPWIAIAGFLQGLKMYYIDLSFQLGKRTSMQIIPVTIGVIINILANLILIPEYGVLGAAYASVFTYIMLVFVSYYLGRKIFIVPFPKIELMKILFSGLVMCISLYPLLAMRGVFVLIIQVVIGLISFMFSIFIFNVSGIRKHMKKLFFKSLKREIRK
ncbi:lipopolysaccharide biosynthesis protein [Peribacillus frigoritolerans]|uniref:lipopolysaccharide biosynthesis protein n=1 Tax=Peribacillus frigoritolerans TaxID=450367 RepID=UPI003F851C24